MNTIQNTTNQLQTNYQAQLESILFIILQDARQCGWNNNRMELHQLAGTLLIEITEELGKDWGETASKSDCLEIAKALEEKNDGESDYSIFIEDVERVFEIIDGKWREDA